jgi:hypothetical protein
MQPRCHAPQEKSLAKTKHARKDDPEQSKVFIEKGPRDWSGRTAFGCGQIDGAVGKDEARAAQIQGLNQWALSR